MRAPTRRSAAEGVPVSGSWGPLGASGVLWGLLEASGGLWGPLGASVGLSPVGRVGRARSTLRGSKDQSMMNNSSIGNNN